MLSEGVPLVLGARYIKTPIAAAVIGRRVESEYVIFGSERENFAQFPGVVRHRLLHR